MMEGRVVREEGSFAMALSAICLLLLFSIVNGDICYLRYHLPKSLYVISHSYLYINREQV
jgi:hypothetical protein